MSQDIAQLLEAAMFAAIDSWRDEVMRREGETRVTPRQICEAVATPLSALFGGLLAATEGMEVEDVTESEVIDELYAALASNLERAFQSVYAKAIQLRKKREQCDG